MRLQRSSVVRTAALLARAGWDPRARDRGGPVLPRGAGGAAGQLLVNLRVPRAWEGLNNAVIAAAVQRSSNAVLVDWHAEAIDHPELVYADHMHLRPQGAEEFASMIAAAV